MEKEYKSKTYRSLLNLLYCVAGTLVIGLIAYQFTRPVYAIAASGVFFCLFIWLVIIDCYVKILVKDGNLIVIKGTKKQAYVIDDCSFSGFTQTSGGETSCKLYITDATGTRHMIDCELIGLRQFNELLEDLRVVGPNATAQKLETQRRDV